MTTITHLLGGRFYAITAMAVAAAFLALAIVRTIRRAPIRNTPAAVRCSALAALGCTAYSADTSWRFAGDYLQMHDLAERAGMFGAGEFALFSLGLLARANLRTKKDPGAPGMLMWLITGVQIIPAFAESGVVGGFVRAFIGPFLAGTMWHLAMGIELRHAEPGALSHSLPAVIARELRERLLSRLGLAVRDRTAEQISRERWTVRAVALAARLAELSEKRRTGLWGRWLARRLSKAVGKAQTGADTEQQRMLLNLLAARRHATSLATVNLPSPWEANLPSGEPVRGPRQAEVRDQVRGEVRPQVRDQVREVQQPAEPAANQGRTSEPRTNANPKPAPRRTTPDAVPAKQSATNPDTPSPMEQVRQVLDLIEEHGYDKVKLPFLMEQTGWKKTAAYNRLVEARAAWAEQHEQDG